MKKLSVLIIVSVFVCIFNSCGSSLDYVKPEFEKSFAYVIDVREIKGSVEDRVRLVNQSSDSDIRFTVYVHDPKNHEWVEFGTGALKGRGDTEFIDSRIDDLDDYRYFAIESLNDKDYRYDCYGKNNDLYIEVKDQ